MVLDPMESRYFAGPAAIIMVESEILGKEKGAYTACLSHDSLCDNAYRPQHLVKVYNSRASRVSSHGPPQAQDSGLNLPRFCVMAWTFLLSSSNFLISSACSAFFLSRSWKR